MTIFENHLVIRKGGNVERFHTDRMLFKQNVAQHSYNASLLAYDIAMSYNSMCEPRDQIDANDIVMYMLLHDISEQATGDMPSFTKRKHPKIALLMNEAESEFFESKFDHTHFSTFDSLDCESKIIAKFCDTFECACTCIEEIKMGNSNFNRVYIRCRTALASMLVSFDNRILEEILELLLGNLDDTLNYL